MLREVDLNTLGAEGCCDVAQQPQKTFQRRNAKEKAPKSSSKSLDIVFAEPAIATPASAAVPGILGADAGGDSTGGPAADDAPASQYYNRMLGNMSKRRTSYIVPFSLMPREEGGAGAKAGRRKDKKALQREAELREFLKQMKHYYEDVDAFELVEEEEASPEKPARRAAAGEEAQQQGDPDGASDALASSSEAAEPTARGFDLRALTPLSEATEEDQPSSSVSSDLAASPADAAATVARASSLSFLSSASTLPTASGASLSLASGGDSNSPASSQSAEEEEKRQQPLPPRRPSVAAFHHRPSRVSHLVQLPQIVSEARGEEPQQQRKLSLLPPRDRASLAPAGRKSVLLPPGGRLSLAPEAGAASGRPSLAPAGRFSLLPASQLREEEEDGEVSEGGKEAQQAERRASVAQRASAAHRLSLLPAPGRKSSLLPGRPSILPPRMSLAPGAPLAGLSEESEPASEPDAAATAAAAMQQQLPQGGAQDDDESAARDQCASAAHDECQLYKALPPPASPTPSPALSPLQQLLALCDQDTDLSQVPAMDKLLSKYADVAKIIKIGEGTYGECAQRGPPQPTQVLVSFCMRRPCVLMPCIWRRGGDQSALTYGKASLTL